MHETEMVREFDYLSTEYYVTVSESGRKIMQEAAGEMIDCLKLHMYKT